MRWPHFVDFYRLLRRAEAKAFSMASARSFSRFGARSVIEPPLRVWGEGRISIGDDVFVGAGRGSRHLIRRRRSLRSATARASRGNSALLSAAVSIRLGKRVLLARNVYIADHMHTFEQAALPVLNQGIARRVHRHWRRSMARPECGHRAGRAHGAGRSHRRQLGCARGRSRPTVAVGAPARVVRTLDEDEVADESAWLGDREASSRVSHRGAPGGKNTS